MMTSRNLWYGFWSGWPHSAALLILLVGAHLNSNIVLADGQEGVEIPAEGFYVEENGTPVAEVIVPSSSAVGIKVVPTEPNALPTDSDSNAPRPKVQVIEEVEVLPSAEPKGAIVRTAPAQVIVVDQVPTPAPKKAFTLASAPNERVAVAIGHYARAHSLLIAALREFDRGMAKASASPLLDVDQFRTTIITRTEELQRVLDPQPRTSRTGIRFQAEPRLLGEAP